MFGMMTRFTDSSLGSAAAIVLASFVTYRTAWWAYLRWLTLRAHSPLPLFTRLLAGFMQAYMYDEEGFFGADGAPAEVQERRRRALEELKQRFDAQAGPKAQQFNERLRDLSDIRFTDTNRVPHCFQQVIRSKLRLGFISVSSDGPYLTDVDGNKALDISGSYGVNVAGYDVYKQCIAEGAKTTGALAPNVLGPLHPCIFHVLERLTKISGLDEVSFHMSGTEAVMCAVRLARFNTRRPLIVQFQGAYHGWWDGVQTGVGNERTVADSLTLRDMSPHSLACIRARRREIAAVLISPLQGLNPGSPPPNDVTLMDSKARATAAKDGKYALWLRQLQALCTECGIALIFDEVYTGFRMAVGGAQEFYGVQADMVVYGKTLGGGMPSGVVCGRREFMQRFDPHHPMRLAYVIGTFAAAPVTLGAMGAFLSWVSSAAAAEAYRTGAARTAEWVLALNTALIAAGYPVRVDHLTTVWTVLFTQPGRYHWMLSYYMRAEGLALSWIGTGRCLFSLDFGDADYAAARDKLLRACERMAAGGWWWDGASSGAIKRALARELAAATLVPPFLKSRCPQKSA